MPSGSDRTWFRTACSNRCAPATTGRKTPVQQEEEEQGGVMAAVEAAPKAAVKAVARAEESIGACFAPSTML